MRNVCAGASVGMDISGVTSSVPQVKRNPPLILFSFIRYSGIVLHSATTAIPHSPANFLQQPNMSYSRNPNLYEINIQIQFKKRKWCISDFYFSTAIIKTAIPCGSQIRRYIHSDLFQCFSISNGSTQVLIAHLF